MHESSSSPTRLYLDKILTLPTLPRKSNDDHAGPFIPNLEHTGIQSSFAPRIRTALMPNGSLNRRSVSDAIVESRDANRKLIEIRTIQPEYQKLYKNSIDRKLVRLEETHLSNQRSYSESFSVKLETKTLHQKVNLRKSLETAHVPLGRTRKVHNKETALEYLISDMGNDDVPYDGGQTQNIDYSQSESVASIIQSPTNNINSYDQCIETTSISSRANSPSRRYGSISKPSSPSRLNSPMVNDDIYGSDWDAGSFESYTSKSTSKSIKSNSLRSLKPRFSHDK